MNNNKLLYSVSFAALLVSSGCQNYTERYDGVTTHAGNHLAVNEAKMVSDPWKKDAYNTHLHGDGKRTADVVDKYSNSHADEDSAGGVTSFVLPSASNAETSN